MCKMILSQTRRFVYIFTYLKYFRTKKEAESIFAPGLFITLSKLKR